MKIYIICITLYIYIIYIYNSILQDMVKEHQDRRALVTADIIKEYMTVRPLNF